MILRPLQPAEAFYRFNTPRWSYRPTSGAGAAKVGGRFNRPGIEALYLSRSVETASAEYQQDEPLLPPGTLVTYRITLSQVVDFQLSSRVSPRGIRHLHAAGPSQRTFACAQAAPSRVICQSRFTDVGQLNGRGIARSGDRTTNASSRGMGGLEATAHRGGQGHVPGRRPFC
jgi:RES domain-containing protein